MTNPSIGSGNGFHSLRHDLVLKIVFSGSEFTTSFTAVFASGVPVAGLLGDPVSPGVSLNVGRLDGSANTLGPPDTSVSSGGDDSSSLADSDVVVSGDGNVNPESVFSFTSSLHGSTSLGGNDHGSFGTNRDIGTVSDSIESDPSVSDRSVNHTVLSADNSVTVGIDRDSSSLGSEHGTVSVLVNLSGDTSVVDVVSTNGDISHLLGSLLDIPSSGVVALDSSLSINNPGVSHVGDSSSASLDVVSELSPVVHGESVELSPSVSHDLTVLGDDHDDSLAVSGDINGLNTLTHALVDSLVVLAHVGSLSRLGNDIDDLGVSADEGSLLSAVKVVPSTVLLESETVTSSGRLVDSPVSEREVSVVVRPSPDLVLSSLDGVVASTNPDIFSHLDSSVFLEGVVLVLSEDGSKVPSVSVTVGLSVVPVKGELGDVVPHSLLARLASLVGPGSNTVGGDSVRVSVLADSNTVSSLTVDSVPVVSSGMGSLLLDVSPDSHVVVTSGVLSNDHQVTRRSSSDIKGSTLELSPGLSSAFVSFGLEDLSVLADNSGLSVVLNSDSVSGTRSVSVNVEFTMLKEGGLASSVDDPDLSVGSSTDINGSHGVRSPLGVLGSERSDDSRVGDSEDLTSGSDSNSVGSSTDDSIVSSGFAIKSGSEDVLVGIDSDISNTGRSLFPGDLIFLLALGSSTDSGVVVREDSSGARVVDKSHGGDSVFVVFGGKTDEGLGVLEEVLVNMAVLAASVSDDDGLTSMESNLETSGDLVVSEGVPVVLDVGNLTVGSLVDLDRLASEVLDVLDGVRVDSVVEVVEHHSELGDEDLSISLRVTE